jgi:hypothetical protein
MSNKSSSVHDDAEDDRAHLDGLPDGCGCAEVWEHLSSIREHSSSD